MCFLESLAPSALSPESLAPCRQPLGPTPFSFPLLSFSPLIDCICCTSPELAPYFRCGGDLLQKSDKGHERIFMLSQSLDGIIIIVVSCGHPFGFDYIILVKGAEYSQSISLSNKFTLLTWH